MNKIGVHHCPHGAGHCHLLTGGKTPSWPFWSLEMGMEMLEFARDNMGLRAERFDLLKTELEVLASTQPRDAKSGRFQKPLLSRRDLGDIDKAHLAQAWSEFFSGKSNTMNYLASVGILGPFVLPLECSFVKRPEGESLEDLTAYSDIGRTYTATPVRV